MKTRRWLLGPAVLIVIAVALGLYIRSALPPERLRGLVQAQLSTALGRPVQLSAVHVSMPPLAIRVDGVRIGAPPGFTAPDLLNIARLDLEPQLLPLLRRQIAIRRIHVVGPEAWIEQRADRIWNWAVPTGGTAGGAPSQRSEGGLDLAIESLEIDPVAVHVASLPFGIDVTLPVAAAIQLAADRGLHNVHLSGWITADSAAVHGKVRGLRVPRLRIEPDVHLNVADSSATLDRIRLWINDAVVDVAGTARQTHGKPEFHLRTRSDGVDLAKLLAALPPETTQSTGLRAQGSLRFDLRADCVPPGLPVAHGTLELHDGMVQAAGLPERVSQLAARVEIAGDSLRITALGAQIGSSPVHLTGLVLDAAQPALARYDVRLNANLDLRELTRVAPMPPGTSLAGRAEVDLRLRGRTARPDSVALEGPVALHDVEIRSADLRQPVHAEARLVGAGTALRIESAQLRAGSSEINLTGSVWPALPPRLPRIALRGTTQRLDLVALLPVATTTAHGTAGTTAGTATAASSAPGAPPLLPVLPAADYTLDLTAREVAFESGTLHDVVFSAEGDPQAADVRVRAGELRADQTVLRSADATLHVAGQHGVGSLRAEHALLQKIEATALTSDLEIAGTEIRLPNMRGAAYGGKLEGKAILDLANAAEPKYAIDATANSIDANTFLGSVTPLRNVITGNIDLKSNWLFAGAEPEQIRRTLSGGGQAMSLNGHIQDLPVVTELASLLGLPSLRNLPYRDLGMQFAIEAGRLAVRDCKIHANDLDAVVGGSLGLDGSLDLTLDLALSAEQSRRAMAARGVGALSSLFTNSDGRLVFDVKVGGTGRAPKLQLDMQKTAGRAGLSALTETTARRLLGGLLGSIPGAAAGPAGSPAAPAVPATPADAGRKALEDAKKKLGGKLGGLLGGQKAPPDSTPGKH